MRVLRYLSSLVLGIAFATNYGHAVRAADGSVNGQQAILFILIIVACPILAWQKGGNNDRH
jgi:hypothetical protein